MPDHSILGFIRKIREEGSLILHRDKAMDQSDKQEDLIQYLQKEYQQELIHYPDGQADFDPQSALWAAKVLYVAANLVLFRDQYDQDLAQLFPFPEPEPHADRHLSVDLCLRFLPDILEELVSINPDDALQYILLQKLEKWHLSAAGIHMDPEKLDFSSFPKPSPIRLIYLDRIISFKNYKLGRHPQFAEEVAASLGAHANTFWPEL